MSQLIRQVIALLCLSLCGAAFGAAGELDASFSGDGVRTAELECCGPSRANAIAPLADGRTIVVGSANDGAQPVVAIFRLLADGSVDPAFGPGGVRRLSIGLRHSYGIAVAIQPDGRIVLAGSYIVAHQGPFGPSTTVNRTFVARLEADGAPDATFGTAGIVLIPSHGMGETVSLPRAIAVQADGRILVAGALLFSSSRDAFVSRLTASGTLDSSFGSSGTARVNPQAGTSLDGQAVAISPNGSIVVVGTYTSGSGTFAAAARFTAAGLLDPTFDGDGFRSPLLGASGEGRAVAVLADGRVLVAGSANGSAAIFRLMADGTPDASYNGTGVVSLVSGIAVDLVDAADSNTYAISWAGAGYIVGNARLHRVSQTGVEDTAFSNTSAAFPNQLALDGQNQDRPGDLEIGPGGTFLVATGTEGPSGPGFFGYHGRAAVFKRAADATAVTGFGDGGKASPPVGVVFPSGEYHGVAVAADGSTTVIHPSNCPPLVVYLDCGRLTRILVDGNADPALDRKLVQPTRGGLEPSRPRTHIRLQAGKILYTHSGPSSGTDQWAVSRLNADGTPDATFTTPLLDGDNPPLTGTTGLLEVYPDGRFLFASTLRLARYLADGAQDNGFNLGVAIFDQFRTSVALLSGGGFFMGRTNGDVVKRDAAGLFDTAFGTNGTANLQVGISSTSVDRLAALGDGSVLVAGRAFESAGGYGTPFVAKLTPTGAFDTAFGSNGVLRISGYRMSGMSLLAGLAVQSDGRIVVAGTDEPLNGTQRGFVARLEALGGFDGSFGVNGVSVFDPAAGGESLRSMQLHPDGGIVLGGSTGRQIDSLRPNGVYAVVKYRGTASTRDIQPAELPVAGLQRSYLEQLTASGGTAPYTFALAAGPLPPGISLQSNGQILGTPTQAGRFSFGVTATDAGSISYSKVVTLVVHSSTTLIASYYNTILGRNPDFPGQDFWRREIDRVTFRGASVSEVFYSMASAFFGSPEYTGRATSNAQFVTDLYRTFFGREPDPSGLAFWTSEIAAGKPRGAVLNDFMFSPEFANYMTRIFGPAASARAEVSMVMDFYRGLLGRLPDDEGLNHWLYRFRTAQCNGTVSAEANAISAAFIYNDEYNAKQNALPAAQRTSAYVVDLYNAFLKRGGDRQGFQFWVSQIDSGGRTREQTRQSFLSSPEFQARVLAVMNQGCIV